ncbi:MAG: hypothetical protein JW969_05230 [Spirochaetales bacterium]|nr:hypothetical protein [Spirochaetales bacterium]
MIKKILLSISFLGLLLSRCGPGQVFTKGNNNRYEYVLSGHNVNDGFTHDALTIIDTKTMMVVKTIPLPRSWAKNFKRDPAGNIWIGYSGNMKKNDNLVQVYSPSGKLLKNIITGPDTDTWQILPFRGKFYLLNAASTHKESDDIIIITPGTPPIIEGIAVAPSPLWGVFVKDTLFTYHNPTWNSTRTDHSRMIPRYNPLTGQSEAWYLPEDFNAYDLSIINGQIILAKWDYWENDKKDGLYLFDPQSGVTSLVLNIADVSTILPWAPGKFYLKTIFLNLDHSSL